jgi:hypothetical protein
VHKYWNSIVFRGAIGLLALINTAHANTQLGAGLAQCSQYVQFMQQTPELSRAIDSWALGYLSGVNFIIHTSKNIDLLADQNSEKIISFIQGYCKASPSKTVTEAANQYWFGLAERIRK